MTRLWRVLREKVWARVNLADNFVLWWLVLIAAFVMVVSVWQGCYID